MPESAGVQKLTNFDFKSDQTNYVFYDGSYMGWRSFTRMFPVGTPGLWIERSLGWSTYATMPVGSWARELIYVPDISPVFMYEVYPGGFVRKYDFGVISPGYYFIWYYADMAGRHSNIFSTTSGWSNWMFVDVYYVGPKPWPPVPPTPTPKQRCEANPNCYWVNGRCECVMDPKILCEREPGCYWRDNKCVCPQKDCEANPQCDWVNNHCYCRGLIDDEQSRCEANPQCDWVNNHCYCRGLNPPTPEPEPGPMPGPIDDPQRAQCESNPNCVWSNGQCNCMGLIGGPVGGQTEDDASGALGGSLA
jgi:hypothetical protein